MSTNNFFCPSFFLLKCGVIAIFFHFFSFVHSAESLDVEIRQKDLSIDEVVENILRADTIKKKAVLKKEIVTSHFVVSGDVLFEENLFRDVFVALPLQPGYNYLSKKDIGNALHAKKRDWKEKWDIVGDSMVIHYIPRKSVVPSVSLPVTTGQNVERKSLKEYSFFSLKDRKKRIAEDELTQYVGREVVVAKNVGFILVKRRAKLLQIEKDVAVFLAYRQRSLPGKKQKRVVRGKQEKSSLEWRYLRF